MSTMKSTITTIRAELAAATARFERATAENNQYATGGTQGRLDAAALYLQAATEQLEAEVKRIAKITSSITTARGAIEWIATTILEREIPGLNMGGPDVDFEAWTSAGPEGRLRAVWEGIIDPGYAAAYISVTPEPHSEGYVTLVVMVYIDGGALFTDSALALARLHLAVAEIAKEIADPWEDKALTLG